MDRRDCFRTDIDILHALNDIPDYESEIEENQETDLFENEDEYVPPPQNRRDSSSDDNSDEQGKIFVIKNNAKTKFYNSYTVFVSV